MWKFWKENSFFTWNKATSPRLLQTCYVWLPHETKVRPQEGNNPQKSPQDFDNHAKSRLNLSCSVDYSKFLGNLGIHSKDINLTKTKRRPKTLCIKFTSDRSP